MSKLLLLGCSQHKRLDIGLMPAIDRYDGPSYRLLRRYLRQFHFSSIDIKILSAKYGLISTDYLLPHYDYRIKQKQLDDFNYQVVADLKKIFKRKIYTKFLICLGKDYLKVISDYESIIPYDLAIQVAKGGIGRKLSILHDWLYEDSSGFRHDQVLPATRSKVRIRDVEVARTQKEILDVARQAIINGLQGATCYQTWYVPVDEYRVAPKWLVSEITGLSVDNFVTSDALRVLNQLGIQVERV